MPYCINIVSEGLYNYLRAFWLTVKNTKILHPQMTPNSQYASLREYDAHPMSTFLLFSSQLGPQMYIQNEGNIITDARAYAHTLIKIAQGIQHWRSRVEMHPTNVPIQYNRQGIPS